MFPGKSQAATSSPGRSLFRLPDVDGSSDDDLKQKLLASPSPDIEERLELPRIAEGDEEKDEIVFSEQKFETPVSPPQTTQAKKFMKFQQRLSDTHAMMSPNVGVFPITARRRQRLASIENTELTEVLTIYEKLKKGRENRVFRNSRFDTTVRLDMEFNEADETVPIVPIFNNLPLEVNTKTLLDFNKYQNLRQTKYFYFSDKTKLLQSDILEGLAPNYSQLLSGSNFWLNIFDPNETDFNTLFNSYGVHDLTLNDIREGNTEDKVEVFKHYTFFSLRLMTENIKDRKENEDIDFNILLFKDFIITMHDRTWIGNADILGFLNLLISHCRMSLTPDWVMFSCFVEMNQDAKYAIQLIEPEINQIRDVKGMEMSDIMRRIFELELQVYSIGRFVKPKARVLRHLKVKCNKRINRIVMNLLNDINDEFREQTQDLTHFNHILERSQDTFLAIVSADQSREANEMSLVMKRISEFALVFLPIQAISGFFGMNVTVPFQTEPGMSSNSGIPFWVIVGCCIIMGTTMYFLRTKILAPRILEQLKRKEKSRPRTTTTSSTTTSLAAIKIDTKYKEF